MDHGERPWQRALAEICLGDRKHSAVVNARLVKSSDKVLVNITDH